jgi:hypothetical protein
MPNDRQPVHLDVDILGRQAAQDVAHGAADHVWPAAGVCDRGQDWLDVCERA